jgi:hypothetical protein
MMLWNYSEIFGLWTQSNNVWDVAFLSRDNESILQISRGVYRCIFKRAAVTYPDLKKQLRARTLEDPSIRALCFAGELWERVGLTRRTYVRTVERAAPCRLAAKSSDHIPSSLCLFLPHVPSRQRRVLNDPEIIRLTLQSNEDVESLVIMIVLLFDHGMPLLMMRQVDSHCPVDVHGNRSTCLKMVAHAPIH